TEVTSNTATAAVFIPISASIATGLGIDPMLLATPVALAASLAFMMPIATPPNAIVFASGRLTIPMMARTGVWINLIMLVLLTIAMMTLVPLVFS
ncbi:MAG: anion permease, partial [Gemmatimonadaceae bacterium]